MRFRGLVPSVGAAASLVAAGAALSLLVASVFGVRVWPSGSDPAESGSVRHAPTVVPAVRIANREPEQARPRVAERAGRAPARTAERRRNADRSPRKRSVAVPAPRARIAPRTRTRPSAPAPAGTAPRSEPDAPAAAVSPPVPEVRHETTPQPVATQPPAVTPAPTAAATQGPVEKTVATVRETVVDPVVNALPTPVASPVTGVLDQVQRTAATVDGLLKHEP
jgi:hypothetical protein